MTQSSKTELITVGTGNGETPIITQTLMPQYMGAVVVCEGADSPSVCLQLTEAVRSLTGITSDNIVISKMQN
jgi:stage III sporulation protein AG